MPSLLRQQRGPRRGIPANPAGWLVTTARRKMVDRLRRAAAAERRHRVWGELSIAWDAGEGTGPIADDRLRLIFTCCHPALSLEARVALTLRSLGGLTTEEVARAFLLSAPALAQRIVRAKRKIREAGIAYRVPSPDQLPERLDAVLTVIYLIFNAGYLAGSGTELVRVDLCDEALRLAGLVVDLLPDEPEPLGLAALLHFQDSRRSARVDADGRPLTLEEQDRGRWDRDKADAGFALLDRARAKNAVGPHQLKAAIGAAAHRSAAGQPHRLGHHRPSLRPSVGVGADAHRPSQPGGGGGHGRCAGGRPGHPGRRPPRRRAG